MRVAGRLVWPDFMHVSFGSITVGDQPRLGGRFRPRASTETTAWLFGLDVRRSRGPFLRDVLQPAGQPKEVLLSSNFGHDDRFACCHFPFVDGGRQIAQC